MPDAVQEFAKICQIHREHTTEKINLIITKLDESLKAAQIHREEIENFLFKGNGKPPVDVRLDRSEQKLKLISWIGGVLFLALISAVGYMIKEMVSGRIPGITQ